MANPFQLSLSFADGGPRQQSSIVNVPSTMTLAQVNAWFDLFIALVDAISESQIVDANMNLKHTLPGGLKAGPASGAENEVGALLRFSAANTNRSYSYRIPGFARGLFAGEEVDTEDGLVDAVVDALVIGLDGGAGLVGATDPYMNDLVALIGSSKSIRRK